MPTVTERRARPKKVDPKIMDMTLAEYIRYNCKDEKSTLAFFKRAGLTYDRNGKPVVVPR